MSPFWRLLEERMPGKKKARRILRRREDLEDRDILPCPESQQLMQPTTDTRLNWVLDKDKTVGMFLSRLYSILLLHKLPSLRMTFLLGKLFTQIPWTTLTAEITIFICSFNRKILNLYIYIFFLLRKNKQFNRNLYQSSGFCKWELQ